MRTQTTVAILVSLLYTAQVSAQQPCIERVCVSPRGGTYVQRFSYSPYYGWYPVSDRRTCNESRLVVMRGQGAFQQPVQPTYRSQTPKVKEKPKMPDMQRPLDCDPKHTYICRIYQKVGDVRKLMRIGTTWQPLGIFTAVHSGQEMVAYVATDDPNKRLLCTLVDWQQKFRRVPTVQKAPEPVPVPVPQQPQDSKPALKKTVDHRDRGPGY